MAIWIKWTEKQKKIMEDWLAERPQVIRDMVAKYDLHMDRLYELTTTGQRVTLHSLSENGTVTVNVLYQFNPERMFMSLQDRAVFGIDPADLRECDWDGEVEDGAQYEDLEDEEG